VTLFHSTTVKPSVERNSNSRGEHLLEFNGSTDRVIKIGSQIQIPAVLYAKQLTCDERRVHVERTYNPKSVA
jgi:hypothetical protein